MAARVDVVEYIYRQPDGTPYLRVRRLPNKTGFPQSHWTGSAWAGGKPKGPKIPYRLPELISASVDMPVFVCEGEKDADRLAGLGFVATTATEGAGKWTLDLNQWFAGKTVYVLADNDEPGAKHARQVADNLTGVAAEVRIVNLPDLPPKGDVSDWLGAGGDPGGLIDLCRNFPVHRRGNGHDAMADGGETTPPRPCGVWQRCRPSNTTRCGSPRPNAWPCVPRPSTRRSNGLGPGHLPRTAMATTFLPNRSRGRTQLMVPTSSIS